MNFTPTTEQIPQLAEWAKNNHLAALTGAGVSMLPPSSLPSWWRLNVDAYKAFAVDDPELREFAEAIEKLPLPPSVLAQFLWEILGPDEYPNSLAVLRSGVPNQNHRVLAALAAGRWLTDIVTLNFDQLHERALAEAGVTFHVNVGSATEPLRGSNNDTMGVWKLHGTIDRPETIFATLDQTTREQGIGPEKKAALRQIRARANLLVLGYSGGDFFLDPDYLGFLSHPCQGTVIWNMRPGEIADDSHPLFRISRQRPEIIICEGVLPELLDRLAAACGVRLPPADASGHDPIRREPIAWKPPQGAWAGHLFSKVFKQIGAADQELACYRWEARQALTYPGPHRTAWAIEGLGVWYLAHGHRELARSFLSALYELLEITGDTSAQQRIRHAFGQLHRRYAPGSAERHEYARRLRVLAEEAGDAAVLNSLGLVQYEEKAHADAIATFERALGIIGDEGTALRATVLGNIALAQAKLGDSGSALNNLSRALEIEDAIGSREGVIYQLRNLGHLYVELGQHAAAIEPLQRAAELEKGIASAHRRAETLRRLGDALSAVNRIDDASVAYERAAAAARESDNPYVWNHLYEFIKEKAAKLQNPTWHGEPTSSEQ